MKTTLSIMRTSRACEAEPYIQDYIVECAPGDKLLDALRTIQRTLDPTLGFRWECRAGVCGTCAVMLDGEPCLSCEAIIEPGKAITIAPLRGFPVLKDLIVDVAPALERLGRLRPYLLADPGPYHIDKALAERSKSFRRCVECFACVAAVSPSQPSEQSRLIDPLGIVKLARFATDPRDKEDRRQLAQLNGIGAYTPDALRAATRACPRGIDIFAAYRELNGERAS